MIEFKKYSSIENSFNREFLEYVVAQMPADLQYVVQEKVHGANTSFLCDGHEVKFAKRTSALVEDEKFYEYPELLVSDRLTPSINFQYAFLSLPAKRILWYIGH